MPLELMREIEYAINELVKWKIDNVRRDQTRRKTSSRDHADQKLWEGWSPYPIKQDVRIRQLSLSPICLALFLRVGQLQVVNKTRFSDQIFIFALNIFLARFASPMMPFQKTYGLKWLFLPLLPIISFQIGSNTISYGIYLDAVAAPIVGHVLRELSDREEIHYILTGCILALVFDMTMLALYTTRSLFWTLAIGVGATVTVQVMGWIIIVLYWDYYPTDFVRKHSHPPYFRALFRFSSQQMIFSTNRVLSRFLSAYFKTLDATSIVRLDMGDDNHGTYSTLLEGYIRLLKILPGKPSDAIQCQFVPTPLTWAEQYEAVSYVWGNSPERNQILVNDEVFSVTESAYRIIHDRRSRLHERLVWIDQVCINQEDPLEKSIQICMMKSIFSRASLVTAWLGPSQDAHLVQSLTADLHFLSEGLGWSGQEIRLNILARYDRAQWTAMARFFRNPWFHRTWILQEVAAAKKLHVMYGNICMDWTYIGRAVGVLFDGPLVDFLTTNTDSGSQTVLQFNVLKRQPATIGLGNADTMLSLRGEIDYKAPFTLFRLLEQCKFFDSTDKRDKVFSLLGLTTDGSEEVLIPDYTATPCSVYIKTMRYLLATWNDPLYALHDAGIALSRTIKDLPSWVPDWSVVSIPPLSPLRFNAGQRVGASVRFDEDPSIIYLDGVVFDSVDSEQNFCSTYSPSTSLSALERAIYFQQWFEEVEELAKRAADLKYIKDLGVAETVFRTIVADQLDYGSQKPSLEEVEEGYAALQTYFSKVLPLLCQERDNMDDLSNECGENALDLLFKLHKIQSMVDSACFGRKFCVTADGRMAIVPDGCRVGDLACIIGGAKLPCLLRKAKKGNREGYRLVGCCYVHGIMYGEEDIDNPVSFTLF